MSAEGTSKLFRVMQERVTKLAGEGAGLDAAEAMIDDCDALSSEHKSALWLCAWANAAPAEDEPPPAAVVHLHFAGRHEG